MHGRFLFDNNFNHRILHGLQLRLPDIDFVIVHELSLKGTTDPELLEWAFRFKRARVCLALAL